MSVSINGTSGLVFNDASTQNTSAFTGGFAFRNRIINGAMVIDQRNAGASLNATTYANYSVDRWCYFVSVGSKFTMQQNAPSLGSVTPPAGFTNYLGITSSSAYPSGAGEAFLVRQFIEGYNTADLGWGTADAKTVTISFWVRSSLTGAFGGSLNNSAETRSFPFSFTINSANTWEQKSITIAGDTTGTWLTTNSTGIALQFNMGCGSSLLGTANTWQAGGKYAPTGSTSVVGTNGATFYITGVQLEKGSTATSFDYRPYGTELQLAQRYYQKSYPVDVVPNTSSDSCVNGVIMAGYSATRCRGGLRFPVQMRATPTMVSYGLFSGSTGQGYNFSTDGTISSGVSIASANTAGFPEVTTPTLTTGNIVGVNYTASAEL
jgi:hypothetical protein